LVDPKSAGGLKIKAVFAFTLRTEATRGSRRWSLDTAPSEKLILSYLLIKLRRIANFTVFSRITIQRQVNKTMKSYPIMLNIKDKAVVVVGGGLIAYRKITGLLQAGAYITVISPVIHSKIEQLFIENKISWKNKLFEPDDLDSALIVIAATNSEIVNTLVASSAGKHQLVNIVDNPELSTFHVPAKLTRGDLTISVATSGASPTLSKSIRDELAVIYDDTYSDYLEFLTLSREKVKHSMFDQKIKTKLLKAITNDTYRQSNNMQNAFLELISGYQDKS